MALELVVESTEGLADGVKELYVEREGKFHLDVNGVPDVNGLTTTLSKQKQAILDSKATNQTLQAQLDQIQADKVAALEKAGKNEEADNLKYEKYKEATDARIARRDERINTLEGSTLENIFRKVAVDAGVHKTAINDVLMHGKNLFKLDANSKAVQFGPDGTPVLGADGTSNFSPSEWIEGQKKASPHWFPASASGGGGVGGGSDGQPSQKSSSDKISAGLKNL